MIVKQSTIFDNPLGQMYSPELVVSSGTTALVSFKIRGLLRCVRGGMAGCATFRLSDLAAALELTSRRVRRILDDPRWFQEVLVLEKGPDPLLRVKVVALKKTIGYLGLSSKDLSFVDGLEGLTAKNYRKAVYEAVVGAFQSLVDKKVKYNQRRKKPRMDKMGREAVHREEEDDSPRSTKTTGSLARQSGTVSGFTLVDRIEDQAQISQAAIGKRIGRSRQTVAKWLKDTAKTRICAIAPNEVASYMSALGLTAAAFSNPETGRAEIFKVYRGVCYRMGCYVYLVDQPALGKRALLRTIKKSTAARLMEIDKAIVTSCAVNSGQKSKLRKGALDHIQSVTN